MHPTDEPQPSKPTPESDADDQPLPVDPEQTDSEDEVEEASEESFPASDPPSYTRSTATD